MKLVSRIKKVQEDLSSLKEQCRKLLAAKQVRRVVIVGDVACGSGREMAVVVAEGRENVAVGGGMGLARK
ncbi:hypothetical protein Acr_20g0000760 [Actinidia rufa]|uniref:Uncharacterized protein n=1 Tax=Actinidia rufa TaxID=165716 RepID=A0A7J0GC47_9ERIC|nr:hypothetical protein Acr_20g0000760 [Actinidia rufa]